MGNFGAVVTTGIYCRPSCGASPNRGNVRTFHLAAAAEAAGFRACLRCRPYRVQPSLSSQAAPELVCTAVRLIVDGALDDGTEHDLGARIGISSRHLRRLVAEHLGVTPDQLARSTRVHFARSLLDDTDLSFAEITFAAGFGSIRQFNRACKEIFRATPSELRARRRARDRLIADGGIMLRMTFTPPFDWRAMLDLMRARAIAGVEQVSADSYRRTVVIDGDPGVLEISPGGPDYLVLRAHLPHWRGLIHIVQRARGIFNLDANVDAANRHLAADPLIGPLVRARPGVRPLGTWDPFETAIEVIAAEHVSGADTALTMQHIVERCGPSVPGVQALGLTRTFPAPQDLVSADLRGLGLSTSGVAAIRQFAQTATDRVRNLPPTARPGALVEEIHTVSARCAHTLGWRLGEPDAFPCASPGLLRGLSHATGQHVTPDRAEDIGDTWRPWRAHAATYLWLNDAAIAFSPSTTAAKSPGSDGRQNSEVSA